MNSVFRPKMKAYINKGITLIVDRYVYSGVAFSAAKEVSVLFHSLCAVLSS